MLGYLSATHALQRLRHKNHNSQARLTLWGEPKFTKNVEKKKSIRKNRRNEKIKKEKLQ